MLTCGHSRTRCRWWLREASRFSLIPKAGEKTCVSCWRAGVQGLPQAVSLWLWRVTGWAGGCRARRREQWLPSLLLICWARRLLSLNNVSRLHRPWKSQFPGQNQRNASREP
jgi:hypothetical protein